MIKASQRVRTESRHYSAETDPEAIISIDRDVDNPNDNTLLFGSFSNQLYFLISEQFVSDFLDEY